jgi:polysaccharide export outer membrane protein
MLNRFPGSLSFQSRPNAAGAVKTAFAALAIALAAVVGGCGTDLNKAPPPFSAQVPTASVSGTNASSLVLQPGDTLKIEFPGTPSLNSSQAIRRDGKITLSSIGEFQAAGLTPSEMEKQLLKLYGAQITTPEVSVTVQSSAFIIYVTGSVAKPGQLISDRHLSPLEAVIEAGVDLAKGNLKSVRIIRTHADGRVERYKVNLKRTLDGKSMDTFTLEPLDVVYVPERFTWF